MKIKVLKSKKTDFPSYFTPVKIVVKGEEEKGAQEKTINVYFSETADKKLPVGFNGGIIECNADDVNVPYVYEIKKEQVKKGKHKGEIVDRYPMIYIKDLISVTKLESKENTCCFLGVEEDTEETEISE